MSPELSGAGVAWLVHLGQRGMWAAECSKGGIGGALLRARQSENYCHPDGTVQGSEKLNGSLS